MSDQNVGQEKRGFSRRLFLKGVGTGVVSASAVTTVLPSLEREAAASSGGEVLGPGLVPVTDVSWVVLPRQDLR